jgi:hypothetical protein
MTRVVLAVLVGLPCLSAFGAVPPAFCTNAATRPSLLDRGCCRQQQRALAPKMADSDMVDEEELDKLVRAEIEAAFAGLEEKFANGEDEEAIKIIQSQGAGVLSSVLEKLDEDGKLLSGQLASKIEALATDESALLLERYSQEIDETRQKMDAERLSIRAEVERLEELNKELQSLQGVGGLSLNKDKIVGGLAFLVGLTGIGAAINEGLKFGFGLASADVFALVANLLLGAAGMYVYFTRK